MTPPLSIAKVTQPRLGRVVMRKRLLDRLNDRNDTHWWIHAPAGYGKTTLAQAWSQLRDQRVIWLRLDETDKDPASFFLHLTEAAHRAGVIAGDRQPIFTREHLVAIGAFTRIFMRHLCNPQNPPHVIVLDDLHQVMDDGFIQQILACLLDELAPVSRLLMLSRQGLPDTLTRKAIHGRLSVLGPDELAFDAEEVRMLLDLHKMTVSRQTVSRMIELTRGWPAGVRVYVHLAENGGQPVEGILSTVPAPVHGYLSAEMFNQLDDEQQQALLETAWLPGIDASALEALPGGSALALLLPQLARDAVFIYAHGDDPPTYTVHPLLAAFLRARAETSLTPDVREQLIQRSAELLADRGDCDAAISLWLTAGDHDSAAALLQDQAPQLMQQARLNTLQECLQAIPAKVRDKYPWLGYWLALGILMADPTRGRDYMIPVYERFKETGDIQGQYLALSYLIGSYFMAYSTTQPLRAWLDEIAGLAPDFDHLPDNNTRANVALSVWYGLFLSEPDHPDLPLWEERLQEALHRPVDKTVKMRIGMLLGKHYYYTGQYRKIWSLRDRLRGDAAASDLAPYGRLVWYLFLIPSYWSEGSFEAAERTLDEALAYAGQTGISTLVNHTRIHAASANLLNGRLAAAEALLEQVQTQSGPGRHMEVWHLFINKAWLESLKGQHAKALEFAEESLDAAYRMGGVAPQCFGLLAMSYCRLRTGDYAAAHADLDALQEKALRSDNPLALFHFHLIQALLARRHGDSPLAHLRAAMAIGRKQHLLHFIWAQPDFLAELCALALQKGIETHYVRELIRARQLTAPDFKAAPEAWPWKVRIRTLGAFSVHIFDEPLQAGRKSQHKVLELLQTLVATNGLVSMEELAYRLWPDSDGLNAAKALESCLYRLRKLLRGPETVLADGGRLLLNPACCWVDTLALEQLSHHIDRQPASTPRAMILELADQLLALYQGPFLVTENDSDWNHGARRKYQGTFTAAILKLGGLLEMHEQWTAAENLYRRALDADPASEVIGRRLLHYYRKFGRASDAIASYERLSLAMSQAFGIRPSAETKALVRHFHTRQN